MTEVPPDIKDIIDRAVKSKELTGTFKLKKLMLLLSVLKGVEDKNKKLEALFFPLKKIKIILVVLSLFLTSAVITIYYSDFYTPILTPLSVILLLSVITTFFVLLESYLTDWRREINNKFQQLLTPLLSALQEDISPGSKIFIKLPLKVSTKSGFRLDDLRSDAKRYLRDYYTIKIPLRDGNVIVLTAQEILTEITKRRFSASGRLKIKKKYKRDTVLQKGLQFNTNRYTRNRELPEADLVKPVKQVIRRKDFIGIRYREKSKAPSRPGLSLVMTPLPEEVLSTIISLYKILEVKEGR